MQSKQQGHHVSMSSSQSTSMLKIRSRNLSGELDVFDATLYFSGRVDDVVERSHQRVDRRRSLDASLGAMLVDKESQKVENVQLKGVKKSKTSRSPGGMLASFLNSLFHQSTSKKKSKSATSSTTSTSSLLVKDGGMRRRSSIALHESTVDGQDSANTGIVAKEQRRCSISSSTGGHKNLEPFLTQRSDNNMNRWALNGSSKKMVYNMDPLWAEVFRRKEEEEAEEINGALGRREKEEDGGWISESSSDLFELKNCEIGVTAGHLSSGGSGLHVSETAELRASKRGAAAAVAVAI